MNVTDLGHWFSERMHVLYKGPYLKRKGIKGDRGVKGEKERMRERKRGNEKRERRREREDGKKGGKQRKRK